MIEKDSIRYLASPVLTSCEGVTHAFLSRAGGVSPAPFDSLNLGYGGAPETDATESIEKNFAILGRALGVSRKNLFAIRQVHGSRVVVAEDENRAQDSPPDPYIEADGAVTALKGVAVGVLTADCLPVLLYDPIKRVAGAAHAGWKGTEKEISAKTVEVMRARFGSRPEDIRAALGPCIGPCCYEIGDDVAQRFSSTKAVLRKDGRTTLDMALANTAQLISAGLSRENITRPGACTSCDNHNFFSYRKDGGSTGRQLSFIMIRG